MATQMLGTVLRILGAHRIGNGVVWAGTSQPAETIPQPTILRLAALITRWFLGGKTRGISTGVVRFRAKSEPMKFADREKIMNTRQLYLVLCLACWIGLGDLALGHAQGGTISPLTIYDSASAPWTVTWNNPNVTITTTPPDGSTPVAQTTAMTLNYAFTQPNTTPLVLTFTEVSVANSSYGGKNGEPSDGLNFKLTEILTNNLVDPIVKISEVLKDSDMMPDAKKNLVYLTQDQEKTLYTNGNAHHPGFSHFHSLGGANYAGFTKNDFDGTNDLELTNGTIKVGDMATIGPIRIHDIVVDKYKRQFTLTITAATANPEPASVIMLSIGMASIVGYTLRRRNRARLGNRPSETV
jgi:hypothetical protein